MADDSKRSEPESEDPTRELESALVRSATANAPGRLVTTPIQCWCRPARKRCQGRLEVRRQDVPADVRWSCSSCGNAGRIAWKRASSDDLSQVNSSGRGKQLEARLSTRAWDVARAIPRLDQRSLALLHRARCEDDSVLLRGKSGDLGRLRAAVELEVESSRRGTTAHRALTSVLMALDEAMIWNAVPDALGLLSFLLSFDPPTHPEPQRRGRAEAADPAASALDALFGAPLPQRAPRKERRRKARGPAGTYRLKVSLRDVRPPIWRRLLVPGSISLVDLHQLLQIAMGWTDSHLHQFRQGQRCYAPLRDDIELDADDSTNVALADLCPDVGSRLIYEYDFGDSWTHDLLVEDIEPGPPGPLRCLAGRRACPPEDCGGPWGYANLLQILADPTHPEHSERLEWLGSELDPEDFAPSKLDAFLTTLPLPPRTRRR